MVKFEHFNKVVARFSSMADFIIIYIEEAHAADAWRFENNMEIKNHRSLEDRIEAANVLQQKGPRCPIFIDSMLNEANLKYGGLFERLYIILDDVIVYEGERGPVGYHVEEVEHWLEKHVS